MPPFDAAAQNCAAVHRCCTRSWPQTRSVQLLKVQIPFHRMLQVRGKCLVHHIQLQVLLLHEPVTPALMSLSASSLAPRSPTSVFIHEQRNGSRSLLCLKEDNAFEKTLDEQLTPASSSSSHQRNNNVDPNQYVNDLQLQLLFRTELWYLWPFLQRKGKPFPMTTEKISTKSENRNYVEADHVVALAREAFSACKEAISIAKDAEFSGAHFDDSSIRGFVSDPARRTVRSTRLLERQSKRRRVPKPIVEANRHRKSESRKKLNIGVDPNDPLRQLLWGPLTSKLLTATEESELIMKIQELMKLQEVRNQLHAQFSREPTLAEWAKAVGISAQSLKLQVLIGERSREKLIYANLRLVAHIAMGYRGLGLELLDLLQMGSKGLMTSVERFKPQLGCKFGTYAYYWIRQSIRKAIYRHSRMIRLPDTVHELLYKVNVAKRSCISQGNYYPTKEDIAAGVGISVEKLEMLLYTTRKPISLQQRVWKGLDIRYEETIADPAIEEPEVSFAKQLMRQHVRNLLSVLNPRERKIIRLRFGIEDGKNKSLTEIGEGIGLTKERIRQIESGALYKLRECIDNHGLAAYKHMLV